MKENMPSISLCVIAKNEEQCITRCIESVRAIVRETIVVDTGSSDSTISIAKSLGATVLFREWDDDFSAPRNVSIQHASGDWILVLDADECIAERDLRTLQELTMRNGVAYEFLQRHYTHDHRISSFTPCRGEYPDEEAAYGGYFVSNLCRLFPRLPGIEYRNRVHELVEPSIYERSDLTIERTAIPIHHYGHTPDVRARKNKAKLYTPLGAQKIIENPEDWKNHFELGVELNGNGRHRESVQAFRSAAALNPRYVQTWINLGYVLNELGSFGSAIEALSRALALEPANPEAHCNIAVTYMRMQRYPFAETHLQRAIQERPQYANALCNLGQTYFAQKKYADAQTCYEKVLALLPRNVTALTDLAAILTQQGETESAISLLRQAIATAPETSKSYYFLGVALKQAQHVEAALDALEQFCSLLKKQNGSDTMITAAQKTMAAWRQELPMHASTDSAASGTDLS
jgi:tetratricopeptide (TPR) repeat protein